MILGWLFLLRKPKLKVPSTSQLAYDRAMAESGELIGAMREANELPAPPVQAVLCEVWSNRRDMRFLATVFELATEAATPKAVP